MCNPPRLSAFNSSRNLCGRTSDSVRQFSQALREIVFFVRADIKIGAAVASGPKGEYLSQLVLSTGVYRE